MIVKIPYSLQYYTKYLIHAMTVKRKKKKDKTNTYQVCGR